MVEPIRYLWVQAPDEYEVEYVVTHQMRVGQIRPVIARLRNFIAHSLQANIDLDGHVQDINDDVLLWHFALPHTLLMFHEIHDGDESDESDDDDDDDGGGGDGEVHDEDDDFPMGDDDGDDAHLGDVPMGDANAGEDDMDSDDSAITRQ
ncbi:hypothetical protein PIB30_022222 [Stylosanthes scabra]|uniref:Uncharacterized protein n=1 Tax=Stylosanthes scabra TaxID=79078 RepID=A0ABU6Z841_9FABA|nr:hypothetical protein [Stylosanthes scabra]